MSEMGLHCLHCKSPKRIGQKKSGILPMHDLPVIGALILHLESQL